MKKLLLLTTFFTSYFIGFSQENPWKQTTTPPGGSIWALAAIGNNIFAGATNGGVYHSSDNGITWTQRNGTIINMRVYSLIVNGNDLFAGADYGIYKSSDLGVSWVEISPAGVPKSFRGGMTISGNDLYISSFSEMNIYKSSLVNIDSNSWTLFNTGLSTANNGQPDIGVRSLATMGNFILAGTYGKGVWISPKDSANWSPTLGMEQNADYIQALCVNDSTVFAGNISGLPVLYRSTDYGANWSMSSTPAFKDKPVYSLINKEDTIYAGTEIDGILMSPDNGNTWTTYNNGFQDEESDSGSWHCNHINVRAMLFVGTTLYAGTDCGVWKTSVPVTALKEKSSLMAVTIFPNPATDYLTINAGNISSSVTHIKIINILGETVFERTIKQNEINIDATQLGSRGVYFVTITNQESNATESRKIIIN